MGSNLDSARDLEVPCRNLFGGGQRIGRAILAARVSGRVIVAHQLSAQQAVRSIVRRPGQIGTPRALVSSAHATAPRRTIGRSVSLDHAAKLLGVSRRTIYNRIRKGRLQTIRTLGGSQRVLIDSMQAGRIEGDH